MFGDALMFFIENFVFWGFVYVIVFLGCETPAIVFTGFGLFLFYWFFRFIFRKEGWERILWLYVVNMIVCIMLLYYFLTGTSYTKSIRSAMNSAARRYPGLEPLVKRC
jgi:hypothetical protein